MFNPEENFHDIKDILPQQGQWIIVYSNKFKKFFEVKFLDGKFFENGNELIDITKWLEINNIIKHDRPCQYLLYHLGGVLQLHIPAFL
jgi:hypothetical protein